MSSVWTVIYIVATIIFIGWLLYRVRFLYQDNPGSRDPAVWHETSTGGGGQRISQSNSDCRQQQRR